MSIIIKIILFFSTSLLFLNCDSLPHDNQLDPDNPNRNGANKQVKIIAQDDFESGTFDGGSGWLDSWQCSGYQSVRPNSKAKQGSYDAVIWGTKEGSYIMRMTSFSSARRPHLQLWGRAESFFVNALSPSEEDYAIVQVSIDTINWHTVATWTMNDNGKPYRFVDVDLSSYAGGSRMFIRITVFFKSTQMLGSYPMFFVDDIKIIDLDSN